MNDPMQFQRPGPMPFRLLIDEAIRQARRHFRVLYLPVAIPIALFATLMAVAQALWFPTMVSNPQASLGMLPAFYLMILIFVGLVVIAYTALLVGVIDAVNGRPVDMKRAWGFALQVRVLGTLILSYVATILSFFCCCLPVLYVGPLLSFTAPVMVDEGRFGFDALVRSANLSNHQTGPDFFNRPVFKVFLFLLVTMLISYTVGMLVALPFQLPMYIDLFRQAASGGESMPDMERWIWLQVPAQFLNGMVSAAVYVYMAFGVALLFYDARGRKEGVDLRSEIDEVFGGSPPELPLR